VDQVGKVVRYQQAVLKKNRLWRAEVTHQSSGWGTEGFGDEALDINMQESVK